MLDSRSESLARFLQQRPLDELKAANLDVSALEGMGTDTNYVLFGALSSALEFGTKGSDTKFGTHLGDMFFGGKSEKAADQIKAGSDTFYGFAGDDIFAGGAGDNDMYGGEGSDTVAYTTANGGVNVNLARDIDSGLTPAGLTDTYGAATATFTRLHNGETITKLAIDDLYSVENAIGGSGNDTFTGDNHNNTFIGNAGSDVLDGRGGNDILIGGAGDDLLTGGSGADAFHLTGGTNTITDFDAHAGDVIEIDMRAYSGASFPDLRTTLENRTVTITDNTDSTVIAEIQLAVGASSYIPVTVIDQNGNRTEFWHTRGTEAGETLNANANTTALFGGDLLIGLGGDDFIFGGSGNDVMNGGTGGDTFILNGGTNTIKDFDAREGDVIEIDMRAYSGASFPDLRTTLENRTVTITDNTDSTVIAEIQLAVGASSYIPVTVIDQNGNRTEFWHTRGTEAGETLNANANTTALFGGDLLIGLGGDDFIFGGTGNDTINGGSGNDVLTGGGGADTFLFEAGFGSAHIKDFSFNEGDKLELLGALTWVKGVLIDGNTTLWTGSDGSELTLDYIY